MNQLFVEPNSTGFGIHADGEEIMAIFRRRGQPDLAAHHDRRGPAAMRNFRFPFHVVRFAPGQRQAFGIGMAVTVRPAKLRPVFGGECDAGQPDARECTCAGKIFHCEGELNNVRRSHAIFVLKGQSSEAGISDHVWSLKE